MGRLIRVLSDAETFPRAISGAMGGSCPPSPTPPGPTPPSPTPPSPFSEPHVVATPAGARPQSAWVQGSELHYIASNGVEYGGTGVAISTPAGAKPFSLWREGEDVFYIDSTGIKRQMLKTAMGAKHSDALAGELRLYPTDPAGHQFQWASGSTRYAFWNGV